MNGTISMTQSNESVKSKGVLLFATNTKNTDYVKIADRASRFIEHYLKLPVKVVSSYNDTPNKRFSVDTGQFVEWKNFGRHRAFELSPWDETILLDSDYIVYNDQLLKLLDTVQDYAMHDSNIYLDDTARYETIGPHSIPMLWATVIVFKRTAKAKMLFDLVARIERNYRYYCYLYNITTTNFRNDFAFTLADNIINGYNNQDRRCRIPWPLITVANPVESMSVENGKITIKEKNRGYLVAQQSLHFLGKEFLLSDQFEKLLP